MTRTKKQTPIFISGDRSLVEEFVRSSRTDIFEFHGFVNGGAKEGRLPDEVRRARTPSRRTHIAIELSSHPASKKKNLKQIEPRLTPNSVILSSSVNIALSSQSAWLTRPERVVGIGAFPTLLSGKLIEVASGRLTSKEPVRAARDFFLQNGKEISVVQDRVGMVMPRILCMIVNEAAFALTEQVATAGDIDTAMKLGTNYPDGPIAWGDRIGFSCVTDLLEAIYHDLQEDRYRIAPLLRQLSSGSRWWKS